MTNLNERMAKIENLAKKSKDKHKGGELQVVDRFVEYYNNTYKTDYILSEKQPLFDGGPVDVLVNSKSDFDKILKIQVKTFDFKFIANISTSASGEFLRIVNQNEPHPIVKQFKEIIPELEIKYEGLVILFDGFYGFNLGEKQAVDLRSLFIDKKFKEVWVVYSEKNCIKLL